MPEEFYVYQGAKGQPLADVLAEALVDCENAHGPARLVLVPLAGAGIVASVPVQPVAHLHYRGGKADCWQVGIVPEGSKSP